MKKSAAVAIKLMKVYKTPIFGAAFLILLGPIPSEAKPRPTPRPTASKASNKSVVQSVNEQAPSSSAIINLGSSQREMNQFM